MASPLGNFKKTSSPRYFSAFNKTPHKSKNSIKYLTAPRSTKTEISLTSKHVITVSKKPFDFTKSSQKSTSVELLNLMYNGLKDEHKYTILGRGGFGTVILTKIADNNIAVKILPNSKEKVSLMKEKNALGLNHPSLVKVLDVIIYPDAPCGLVLMQPLSSLTLHMLIHNSYRPISPQERLRYLLSISAGLEYCHSMGVIHLDVKPLNVLVDLTRKTCKLCDFGSSYNYLKKDNETLINNDWNRQGTIAYAAPELLKGDQPTVKCDVYSFGIMMWQFLHCELPYNGIPKNTLIYKVISLGERPSCFIFDESEYSDLYRKCWSTFPGNRPSISNIKNELQFLLSKSSSKYSMPIFQLL